MYFAVLLIHSWLRWVVLALGVWAVVRAWGAAGGGRRLAVDSDSSARLFSISLDVQFLLGIALYGFLSPITAQALGDLSGAMRDPLLRYWGVEHVFGMVVALVLVHIGRGRARRARPGGLPSRAPAVLYTLALIVLLASIPWPFMPAGRPLVRF